jgi:hypothetical protein
MTKLLGALAAVMLAIMLLAPSAEARCWSDGYRWHCTHHRYHHYAGYGYPYYGYGYYPYSYGYPYRPYGYYPLVCVGPLCL